MGNIDPAAIVAGVSGVVVSLTALITAFTVLLRAVKGNRSALDDNTAVTYATHKLVNSQADDQIAYLKLLVSALREAGIVVPVNPAIDEQNGGGEDGGRPAV